MLKSRLIYLILLSAGMGYLVQSCANIVRPNGGEKDSEGPKVETFLPPNGTLNFSEKQIVVRFNEYLKEGSYGDQVFISPVPEVKPEVIVRNKELIIKFRSPLLDSTTYVINIGKGIKDFNEGNDMSSPLTYAFSTGDRLDSMYFRGTAVDAWTGASAKNLKLLLFLADSVPDNDFTGKRPMYVAESDDQNGSFSFLYLRNQKYKLFGLVDSDNSYSLSSDKEPIALLADPLIDVSDSNLLKRSILLESFLPDEEGPLLKSAKILNPFTIHVELKEKIRPEFGGDSLMIFLSDTSGNGSQLIKNKHFVFLSETDLLLDANWKDSIPAKLEFRNLFDSLGNRGDTSVILSAKTRSKLGDGKAFFAPKFDLEKQRVYLESLLPIDSFGNWSEFFVIEDTGKIGLPLKAEFTSPYQMTFAFEEKPNPKMKYSIKIKPGFIFRDSVLKDTMPPINVNFPSKEDFGSITGKILPDSSDPADMQYILLLLSQGNKGGFSVIRRTKGEREFKFEWLNPGKYRVLIIKDADRNLYWSPGSISPYKLPEQVYRDPETLEVRANWDLENYTVMPIKQKPGAGKSKGGKLSGDDGKKENPDTDK